MLAPDLAGTGGEMSVEQEEEQKKFNLLLNLFDLIEKNIDLSIKLARSSLNFDYLPAVRTEKSVSIVGIVPEKDKHVFIGAELAEELGSFGAGFSEIFERINAVVSDKGATISDVDKLVFTFYFERSLQFMKFLTRFDKFRLQSNEGLLSADELAEYITGVLEVDGLDSGFGRADGAGNSGVNGSK